MAVPTGAAHRVHAPTRGNAAGPQRQAAQSKHEARRHRSRAERTGSTPVAAGCASRYSAEEVELEQAAAAESAGLEQAAGSTPPRAAAPARVRATARVR